jgi:hypothetical protein
MSSYSELYVSNYPVYSSGNGVDRTVMTIFREGDKRVFERKVSERNQLAWGHIEDEGEIETVYEYSNTVANIRQRLEVMGFSLDKVKKQVCEGMIESIEHLKSMRAYLPNSATSDLLRSHYLAEQSLLENTEFADWLSAYKNIIKRKLRSQGKSVDLRLAKKPLVSYILQNELMPGFVYKDPREFLRVLLEVSPDAESVTYDITDIIAGGYFDPEDSVCELALTSLSQDYPINGKIVILTEGSSDKNILEKSLSLLYPHLSEYYFFMDFDLSNAPGGANFLVSTIKAFIGAGIKNRIVALFDNDTAAEVSLKSLKNITTPDNVKILKYPDLEIATRYPTIGPGGISELNVNGLACSIELYLGTDILIRNGELTPIQWKGCDPNLNRYQGEILNKKELQEAFFKKVSKCSIDPSLINKTDWEPIHLILNRIFESFC